MSKRRVVVTGLGIISPVGNTVAEAWSNIVAGRSGVGPVTKYDVSAMNSRMAGEFRFHVDGVPGQEARHVDTFIHYRVAASLQAVADAGLPHGDQLNEESAQRIGCLVGSGIGGLPMIEHNYKEYHERGARRISPFLIPASIINMISGHVSIKLGFTGPNLGVVTACTTGLHGIGLAARLIQYGDADAMVAGGADSTISALGIGGFAAARALSTRNDARRRAPGTGDATVL
jgi:3-oxoacyl-[acyl-carrier-protein] synthase II